jgi:hypothetical protein
VLALIAAVITCAGTVAAALITTRKAGPAGTVPAPATGTATATAPVSKAFWLGLAGLAAWIIPVAAYVLVLPGLYIGIREQNGPRRLTAPGTVLCAVSLGLAVINSAVGAWQGAHGTGWWQ